MTGGQPRPTRYKADSERSVSSAIQNGDDRDEEVEPVGIVKETTSVEEAITVEVKNAGELYAENMVVRGNPSERLPSEKGSGENRGKGEAEEGRTSGRSLMNLYEPIGEKSVDRLTSLIYYAQGETGRNSYEGPLDEETVAKLVAEQAALLQIDEKITLLRNIANEDITTTIGDRLTRGGIATTAIDRLNEEEKAVLLVAIHELSDAEIGILLTHLLRAVLHQRLPESVQH